MSICIPEEPPSAHWGKSIDTVIVHCEVNQPLFWTCPPHVWIDCHTEIHQRFLFCKTAALGKIHYNDTIILILSYLQHLYYILSYSDKNGKGLCILFLTFSGTFLLLTISSFCWQCSIKVQWIMTLKRRNKISWVPPEMMGMQHSLLHVLPVIFISSFRIYAYYHWVLLWLFSAPAAPICT